MSYESILIIPVPTAEPVVKQCRTRYDPSAADGMPAHITINYPFVHDERDYDQTVGKLEELFSGVETFDFTIPSFDQFPGVLYLKPAPTEPFVRLVESVADLFPDSPPYEGKHSEINPHLTIAQLENERLLETVRTEFLSRCGKKLPIISRADQVWLMDNRAGTWIKRRTFKLK